MLANEVAAGAWRLKIFETLDSTSDLCRKLAEAGEPERLAVLARWQERGRGQGSRVWISTPGNLYLSVLLRPRGTLREAGAWTLLAGVALTMTLASFAPDPSVFSLKWPNDVLLNNRKLAGVLVESMADATGALDWIVVGFGVNLASAPKLPGRDIAALAELVPAPPPKKVAECLLAELDHWRTLSDAEGAAPVRGAWLRFAHPIGTPLSFAFVGRTIEGSFAGISDDGSLLLRTGGRVLVFPAGEIVSRERG